MFKLTHREIEEFGGRAETTCLGVYPTKEAALQAAAESGLNGCKVSAYKLTPAEAKRAALLASFGKTYIPAHAK